MKSKLLPIILASFTLTSCGHFAVAQAKPGESGSPCTDITPNCNVTVTVTAATGGGKCKAKVDLERVYVNPGNGPTIIKWSIDTADYYFAGGGGIAFNKTTGDKPRPGTFSTGTGGGPRLTVLNDNHLRTSPKHGHFGYTVYVTDKDGKDCEPLDPWVDNN
jgi:hypothetical protein